MRMIVFGLAVGLAFAACQGDKGTPDSAAGEDFAAIRDEILLPSCGFSTCHGSGTGGLTLDETTTADDLVGTASTINPVDILVIAGDAENSYIVRKMEARLPLSGEPMPPPSGAEPEQIERVRAWIDAGAL